MQSAKGIRPITLSAGRAVPAGDASCGIASASVTGDVLTLKIFYSGGCREHDFELVGPADLAESSPRELATALLHNSNGDECKKLVTEDLRFDLSPLKELYRRAYGEPSGSVMLRVLDRTIEYPFAISPKRPSG